MNAKKLHSHSKGRLDIFMKEKFTEDVLIQSMMLGKSPELKVTQDTGRYGS